MNLMQAAYRRVWVTPVVFSIGVALVLLVSPWLGALVMSWPVLLMAWAKHDLVRANGQWEREP